MRFLTTITGLLLTLSVSGQTVFDKYFENAKAFSEAFPREKVYIHFDNTSYYQGDTIWFKAYCVTEAGNRFSQISKPLYVELVDQLGNVMERQIVKLENGQGEGQISLNNAFFTGYYEVRSYTKWMLAFNSEKYFSRTFPIYKKPASNAGNKREIAEYRMDESMKQRPQEKLDKLTARFYPEGGKLIQGIPSVVGLETLSADSGWVNITGTLISADSQSRIPVSTIHDGMGSFMYTPGEKPAELEFEFDGKKHSFKLPEAEPTGYNIRVASRNEEFDVTVSRNAQTQSRPLALFVFSDGVPQTYVPIDLSTSASKRIKIMTADIPAGITRFSLVDEQGMTLLDRFGFVYPKNTIGIKAETNQAVYAAFDKVGCSLKLTDSIGKPLAGVPVSVSLRNISGGDYIENDNNILTSLLLTSELKGHINRPGFYFAERTRGRQKMLDNLLLIRGWRNYDTEQAFGVKEFQPKYMPEDKLMLYGRVRSYFQGNGNLGVTILANNDSTQVAGSTVTDSIGRFSVPLDDFEGHMEALFQTRKEGKKINRAAVISLERQFEPDARLYDFLELNPTWDVPADSSAVKQLIADVDPYAAEEEDVIVLNELVVKAKNGKSQTAYETERFERSILGYYNFPQILDKMRDEGKVIGADIGYLMHEVNRNINREGTHYKVSPIIYCIRGNNIEKHFVDAFIENIETIMLYYDRSGTKSFSIGDDFKVDERSAEDYWTGVSADTAHVAAQREMFVRMDFTMDVRFNPNRSYLETRGIRKTHIQGYNRPAEFYSPMYPDGAADAFDDYRRTLYWNPSLKTDENGEIHIDCYNSHNPSILTVSAETLVNGIPAAMSKNSIEASKGSNVLHNTATQ